jgi:hypothetical protein
MPASSGPLIVGSGNNGVDAATLAPRDAVELDDDGATDTEAREEPDALDATLVVGTNGATAPRDDTCSRATHAAMRGVSDGSDGKAAITAALWKRKRHQQRDDEGRAGAKNVSRATPTACRSAVCDDGQGTRERRSSDWWAASHLAGLHSSCSGVSDARRRVRDGAECRRAVAASSAHHALERAANVLVKHLQQAGRPHARPTSRDRRSPIDKRRHAGVSDAVAAPAAAAHGGRQPAATHAQQSSLVDWARGRTILLEVAMGCSAGAEECSEGGFGVRRFRGFDL